MPSGVKVKVDYAEYKELINQRDELEKENETLRARLKAEQRKTEQRKAENEIKKDVRKGGKENV